MSTATKKMNGTSKKQTSKKSGSIAGNKPTKKYSRNGIEDIAFEMSEIEQAQYKQNKATESDLSEVVKDIKKNLTHLTLTDYEEKLDYAEIKIIKNPKVLVIEDGEITEDYEDIKLPDGNTYQCYKSFGIDFNVHTTRGNGRSMKKGQKLTKSCKSYVLSAITKPNSIIWNSTKFNIICDSKRLEIREDGIYLILEGDIQIRDGGNRSVGLEMVKQYIKKYNLKDVETVLADMIQEFIVRERGTFEDDMESAIACINQNNSTPHKDVERIRSLGALNDIPLYCGKYSNNVVIREAEITDDSTFVVDFLEDAGCFDYFRYFTEISEIYAKTKNKSEKVHNHCVKNYMDTTLINKIEAACMNGKFESETWFGFLDGIGEELFELHMFLNNEFLKMVQKKVESGEFSESYITTICSNYEVGRKKLNWTKGYRKYVVTCLKPLLCKDSSGNICFKYSPVEALKNEDFLDDVLFGIETATSIDNISDTHKSKSRKASSSDYRNVKIAQKLYNEAKKSLRRRLDIKF